MNEDSKNEQGTTNQPTVEVEEKHETEVQEASESVENKDTDSSPDVENEDTDSSPDQDVESHLTPDAEQENLEVIEASTVESDEGESTSETNESDEAPTTDEALSSIEPSAAETATDTDTPADTDTAEPDISDIESLEEAYDNSLKAFSEGEVVKGTAVDVSHDEIMVDIGFKSEGYIPTSEFEIGEDGLPSVRIGDQIDVYIVRREDAEGQIVLSKQIADQKLIWDEIAKAYEEGQTVEGKVVERIKGGLRVEVGKLRAFLPASQIELRPVQNFDKYTGMTLEMKVVKLSRRRRNIVLSRRALLEEELSARKAELLNTLEVEQIRSGVVKNITSFGAFVDLGGIDGLLHKTDMSWGRVNHPSEIISVGDQIEVKITDIDHGNEKVSLGLKQKTTDPWLDVEEKYPVGSTVQGEVVNIVNYGAFLELEEGVEGLIHVSEMSWTKRNVAPSKILNKGDKIEAVVLDIDKENKRISLGLKQLQSNPWELLETKYPIGTKITGRVRNLTDFGAFVEIEDGIDGLIHTSDLSWVRRDIHPREILKEGDEVEVMVLSIDPAEQKVSLGLKQIEPDPWLQVPEKYRIGSVVRGEIVNLTSFGAFAKLEDGIEGLIHISELADHRIEKPEEVVSIGNQLDLKVIHLDATERRIGLSLKAARAEQERAVVTQYQQQQETEEPERPTTTLGALLKEELDKSNSENE
jgi:small subunit ribosomal protein S1